MSRPPLRMLAGTKILSFTQFLLGPAGVQYLADMGADVIKIEPPGTGAFERSWAGGNTFLNGVSAFYLLSHRNARSLTLNLKRPEAQEIARQLIAEADVLVENFRPGVIEKFGLGYEQVKALNPRLIYVAASGYGENTPYRDLPGQDLLLQARTGLASITGRQGELPTPAGAPIVDQHGAALLAMGVLGALLERHQTGLGQKIEVTMVQAGLDLQLEAATYHLNGKDLRRSESGLGSCFHQAPYGIYETRDGYLAISMSPIKAIYEAIGAEELAPFIDPPLAMTRREEIRQILQTIMPRHTTSEWMELLRPHGIWVAPVNTYREVFADPVVQHLDPVLEMDHPVAGKFRTLRFPVTFSSGEPELRRLPPEVGQDTGEILGGLGYSPEEIRRLQEEKVI